MAKSEGKVSEMPKSGGNFQANSFSLTKCSETLGSTGKPESSSFSLSKVGKKL